LAPEEQVLAEQLLQGGLPGVREAVKKQNEQARAEGRPEVKAEPLLAAAERLLPPLRVAEWRDRAEAAVTDLDELDLRDLRSVVVAADTGAKDDEGRALADQLRQGLARRVDSEQAAWLSDITQTLGEGRVVRALRLSSRPPKAGAPLPAELATKLAEGASGALTADTLPDRWATVLDALSFSPVRLQVSPASKPDSPSEELIAVVSRVAGRVPKVAEAFGITPPPESAGRRGRKPSGSKPRKVRAAKADAPKADSPKAKAPKAAAPKADAPKADAATSEPTEAPAEGAQAPTEAVQAEPEGTRSEAAADASAAVDPTPGSEVESPT